MTANTFSALCAERSIDPAIALENDDVREALASKDDARVIETLDNDF